MRSLPVLSLLAVFLLILTAVAKEALPTDPEALYQYAQKHHNYKQWRDAERAYKAFLERYKDHKYAPEATWRMAQLQMGPARRYVVARDWYKRYVDTYGEKAPQYWNARMGIASSYRSQNLKEPALKEFRKIRADATAAKRVNVQANAIQNILNLKNQYLRPYVNQSFTAGERPVIRVNSRNIARAKMRVYRYNSKVLGEIIEAKRVNVQAAVLDLEKKDRTLIEERILPLAVAKWFNGKIHLNVTDAGVYGVEVEHVEEEFTVSVTVVINRIGLITKSDSNRLLVYAQDRRTGAPVPGVKVRAIHGKRMVEDLTGKDGLFVANGMGQSIVFGTLNDEYVFATGDASWYARRESRYYVFTDRPIYRPKQTVRVKVVHRIENAGELAVQDKLRLKVKVTDPRNNPVAEFEGEVNEFGSISGSFVLGAEPALGRYNIQIAPLDTTAPMQGWYGSKLASRGQFRVDEYRKPEYKVGVTFQSPRYIQGETLRAEIDATYYFGSPVPNAKVRWTLYKTRHWNYFWRKIPSWYRWYGDVSRGRSSGYYGDVVAKGEGQTDIDGKLPMSYPIPEDEYDVRYSVVAEVTDLSRRQETASAVVNAHEASFGLGVEVERGVVESDRPFEILVHARAHDGKSVVGRAVNVQILHRNWRNQKYVENEVATLRGVTGEDGIARVQVKLDGSGSFLIHATAQDESDRSTSSRRYLWVVSDRWNGGNMRWDGVDVVPDRDAYRLGDVARFLVTSKVKDATVLFTLEGEKLHDHRVVKLNGHTATIEYKINQEALVPNFYASVSTLHSGKMYQRHKSVAVDPTHRFFTVDIKPDREKYRPREKATFTLIAKDFAGRPVAADIALGIVDESIYALQSEFVADMRQFFVRRRYNRVRTNTSLRFYDWGRVRNLRDGESDKRAEAPSESAVETRSGLGGAMAPKAKAAGKMQLAKTEVRGNFADTMFWTPTVRTDKNGRATITVDKLPDNLTTWRITARGMSRGGLVGQAKDTVLVRKDLTVRLATPRFYTQGDTSTLSAIVRNDLPFAKDVVVRISATGLDLSGPHEVTVHLTPRTEQRLDWQVAMAAAGRAEITVHALTDIESDAVKKKVPVLPHGSLQWTSHAGLLDKTVRREINVPEDSIEGAADLLVTVSPSHAATVLEALDYLAAYPYGCVEQTMSRFLPTALTAQVLRRLKISKPELEAELPHMIQSGLQRLYGFQHQDGGWGWWKNDASNSFTSAYVVFGLAQAQNADVNVSDRVLKRGIAFAIKRAEVATSVEERAYLLYALSAAGESLPRVRNALADHAKDLSPSLQAMVALVLHKDGVKDEAKRVLAIMADGAERTGGTAYFKGAKNYHWTGHRVDATALALQALLAIDPQHELVEKIVAWLSLNRDGRYWVSTRQTALVVFAMSEYLAQNKDELEPDMKIRVSLNGEQLFEKHVDKSNWYDFEGTIKVSGDRLRPGKNVLTIEKSGTGKPVYSTFFRRFRRAATFEASTGGLTIAREYRRIQKTGDPTKGGVTITELKPGDTVQSGDEIEVVLTVKTDQPRRYLMIEDPLPAGCEPVRNPTPQRWIGRAWNYWYAHKEFRDEKVDIAVTHLSGEQRVSYRMRAEAPGMFKVLPARVWNMYQPEEGANSAGTSLGIKD